MYIRYICNKKCQVTLSLIYFSPILRKFVFEKNRNIIHEICRNSHFRALKIQNFIRPPTGGEHFFVYSPPPPRYFWNGDAVPHPSFNPLSANPKRQFAEELFQCVWPFCEICALRVKSSHRNKSVNKSVLKKFGKFENIFVGASFYNVVGLILWWLLLRFNSSESCSCTYLNKISKF